MALNINGTTGISGVDGSASAPAVTGTDSNTGINFGTDTVNINTGGTERMRINSAGSVGIGTSSIDTGYGSSHKLQITSVSDNNWGGSLVLSSADGSSVFSRLVASTSGFDFINTKATSSRFFTNNTERMRIDSDGTLCIGTTSDHGTGDVISVSGAAHIMEIQNTSTAGHRTITLKHARASGGTSAEQIVFEAHDGGAVGSIQSTGSATSYNTSSDYRLKENESAISDGITRLKTLKPYRFNFKVDASTTVDGFFAHEVTAVPEAISGTKDAVVTQAMIDAGEYTADKLDQEIHQGIDQSKLVPLLTAALQEAIAKIEVLETKVAALEAG